MKRIFLIHILSIFMCTQYGCSDSIYDERLEGYHANDPLMGLTKQYTRYYEYLKIWGTGILIIDTLKITDTVFIAVSEFNRADGKPSPARGEDLYVTVKTNNGDHEILPLDSEATFLGHADNITPYIKYLTKRIAAPEKYNGILELNSQGDIIFFNYKSYWHGHEVKDTVYFNNKSISQ